MRRVIVLCYHDVVGAPASGAASGFSGPDTASYKLDRAEFRRHLEAIAAGPPGSPEVRLTFDDGGVSTYTEIAPLLEEFNRWGYFFIPTSFIGTPGFLAKWQIRDLSLRGHVIGSHSRSHRGRMPGFAWERLAAEWIDSVAALADITGQAITSAAAPSGFYAPRVADAAACAGIRELFTLEPTLRTHAVAGCVVRGRYLIKRHTSASTVARLAAGAPVERGRQFVFWNVKKAARTVLGSAYPRLRKSYFAWQGGPDA